MGFNFGSNPSSLCGTSSGTVRFYLRLLEHRYLKCVMLVSIVRNRKLTGIPGCWVMVAPLIWDQVRAGSSPVIPIPLLLRVFAKQYMVYLPNMRILLVEVH